MGYSRKKQTGIEDILFWTPAPLPGIFRYVTLPLEIPEKISFYPWKFCKIVWHPLEIPRSKTKTYAMEIPHDFFLNTNGNSSSFFIDPWNSHMLFLQYLLDRAGETGGARGTMALHIFSKQKKKKNNNCNKLKIHNITSWIGQSICYYLDFIWFSPFAYVCKACTFFSCYYYRIQLFYSYKI